MIATLVTLTLWFGAAAGAGAQDAADDRQVKAIAARWEQAWNGHDMKALAALFTEDADFVNLGARHWKGLYSASSSGARRPPLTSRRTIPTLLDATRLFTKRGVVGV